MTTENRITITVDGQQVQAKPGSMALEAAMEAGIYVPYLCYHTGMKPFAACRMCVVQEEVEVEVERDGQKVKEKQLRPPTASCTLPVRPGLVIKTATDSLRQLQRGILEMLISEHPHGCLTCHRIELCGPEDICQRHVSVNDRCVICPKNERCELKDTVRFFGMELESPLSYKTRDLPVEEADPFYDRDYNLCIVCGRCVRVCEEVRGDSAITFIERAGQSLVGTSRGTSLLESGCEFCGACLDVCPVGALVERDHKWDKAVRVERTVCPHCPVGCQLNLEVNKREKVIRAIPEINAPANRGQACFKGKFGLEYINHKDRLKHPLIRRNGQLEAATWEEALSLIAETLPKYKGGAFAAIASARNTNETDYLLQKFTRSVMGSNNVDVDSNILPAPARALAEPLGYAASTNPIWDLEGAKCILAVDTNTTEEHNVVGVPIKRATKKGAKLIVIDAREVELTRYAHLWLRPRPGTTLTLLGGMLRVILEQGLADQAYLQEHCDGLDGLRASLEPFTLQHVAQFTGVPEGEILQAAGVYATSGASAILYALDNVPAEEPGQVHALANLALVTGNVGKQSTGLYALPRGANGQGAMDVGCAPDMLPGYQRIDHEPVRQRFAQAWGTQLSEQPGLGVAPALQAAREGSVKAMLLLGDSVSSALSEWDQGHEALERLEFLVVQDAFLGPAAQRAHVVLPATSFAEEDGTYTNLERRVQLLKKAVSPKNTQAEPGWQSICRLAQRMGAQGFGFQTTAEVFDEIASLVAIYGGISHQRIQKEATITLRPDPINPQPTQLLHSDRISRGIQWPCPDATTPGTPVLYSEGFPMGRAKLMALPSPRPAAQRPREFPLLFVPGRVLLQEGRDSGVVRVGGVNIVARKELVEMHPLDMAEAGIQEGEAVELVLPTGQRIGGAAWDSQRAHRGVVSMTTLFGELATRLQASEDPDPMASVPGLSVSAARLEKATG
ncbi:MAG: 4Fe-4S dicluster domain-containing protein [Dehalococcoidia bacterium]|nr:4Fe-4S dicluster domain-containing protein [Dehalococcoidia bacterium]